MNATPEPRVDAYIDQLPGWQQAICRDVRDLVHAPDPAVEETIKRRVQPYFVLEGNVCALLAAKRHVCIFFYRFARRVYDEPWRRLRKRGRIERSTRIRDPVSRTSTGPNPVA